MVPLDRIDGIVTLLLDCFPNVNPHQRTGLQQDVATIMYKCPVLNWNLRVQYRNSEENLTHPSGPDLLNLLASQVAPRDIQVLQERPLSFPHLLDQWMHREEMKRKVSETLRIQDQKIKKLRE